MKRKFSSGRLGKLFKAILIVWIVLLFGLGVYGIVGYFVNNCQSVQKEYNEQLSNFKKEAKLQEKKKAELIIEFEKSYPKPEGRIISAEEFLLKKNAKKEFLEQNGINLELFPEKGGRITTSFEFATEKVFEKEYPEIAAKNYCTLSGERAGVGLVLSITVVIFYLLFLYIFPKTEIDKN